jgi:hypothetical protein
MKQDTELGRFTKDSVMIVNKAVVRLNLNFENKAPVNLQKPCRTYFHTAHRYVQLIVLLCSTIYMQERFIEKFSGDVENVAIATANAQREHGQKAPVIKLVGSAYMYTKACRSFFHARLIVTMNFACGIDVREIASAYGL